MSIFHPRHALIVTLGLSLLAGCSLPHRRERVSDTLAAVPSKVPPASSKETEVGHFGELARTPVQAAEAEGDVPLLPGLGTLHHYRITTRDPLAQRYFDQGLRLAYAFNHAEAARAFRKAQRLDPGCAMCFWGEALVLGPNINAPMDPVAHGQALEAAAKARTVAGKASPREQALIDALAERYSHELGQNRSALDRAYADAMAEVAARYPGDDQIAVLYAESLLDLSPWDYWEEGGAKPKGRTAELVQVLERVLRRNPNHPGAIHYYIHAVSASDRPERAEAYADRLGGLMPGAGHLVHMPAHIYFRIGRYKDSIAANRKAIAADEAYFERVGRRPGIYADAYYLHNVHFLMTSAQMAGDGPTAIEAAEKLARIVSDQAAEATPLVQPIKAAPFFAHAQFSPPETVLALAEPSDRLPYAKAAWHYARGVASAAAGDGDGADREASAIARLRERADWSRLTTARVPATDVLDIAARVVRARLAQSRGDLRTAEAELEAAAQLQERLSYMEPPFWYYPVRQTLGAVRLQADDLDGAEQTFRTVLEDAPQNAWALYGLRAVHERRGEIRQVRSVDRRLAKTWMGDKSGPGLERL